MLSLSIKKEEKRKSLHKNSFSSSSYSEMTARDYQNLVPPNVSSKINELF